MFVCEVPWSQSGFSHFVLLQRSIIPNITGICPPDQAILGSGLYRIHLPNVQAFTAYCDMETDGGGYLVFQRREDGSVDFYRDYAEYVKGFGDQRGEHWLGLELLHRLTSAYKFKLRVDLADWSGQTAYASYSTFSIANASDGYRLSVGGYSGTAGDSMSGHSGQKFSARNVDQDVYDGKCAILYRGAWWYSACHSSNLNSVYERATATTYANTVVWYDWKGHHYSPQIHSDEDQACSLKRSLLTTQPFVQSLSSYNLRKTRQLILLVSTSRHLHCAFVLATYIAHSFSELSSSSSGILFHTLTAIDIQPSSLPQSPFSLPERTPVQTFLLLIL